MKIVKLVQFEWDKGNKEKNWLSHKVNFKECEEVFFDEEVKFFKDYQHSNLEDRFLAYGKTVEGRKLSIVFTLRGEKIRVISARDQNKKERGVYEQA